MQGHTKGRQEAAYHDERRHLVLARVPSQPPTVGTRALSSPSWWDRGPPHYFLLGISFFFFISTLGAHVLKFP